MLSDKDSPRRCLRLMNNLGLRRTILMEETCRHTREFRETSEFGSLHTLVSNGNRSDQHKSREEQGAHHGGEVRSEDAHQLRQTMMY